jgi:hypothetical protein
VKVNLLASGALFQPGIARKAIDRAVQRTAKEGAKIIADRTPVRSGDLQEGWHPVKDGILNEVPYCGYVENGTSRSVGRFMVRRSVSEIEQLLESELEKELRDLQ